MKDTREIWEQKFFASLQTLFPHELLENTHECIFGHYLVRFVKRPHPNVAISAANFKRVAFTEKLFEAALDQDPADVAVTVADWIKEKHGP